MFNASYNKKKTHSSYLGDMRKKELDFVSLHFRPDGILHLHYHSAKELTQMHAEKTFLECREMMADITPVPLLVTGDPGLNTNSEFRKFNATKEVLEHTTAVAAVIDSFAYVLLVNFFNQMHQPYRPVKMFRSKEKAIEWLLKK